MGEKGELGVMRRLIVEHLRSDSEKKRKYYKGEDDKIYCVITDDFGFSELYLCDKLSRPRPGHRIVNVWLRITDNIISSKRCVDYGDCVCEYCSQGLTIVKDI